MSRCRPGAIGADWSDDMPDEPKFLQAPPPPAAPTAASEMPDEIRAEINDAAKSAVDRALPGVLAASVAYQKRTWDQRARPPVTPVEHRMGPVSITVPGRWHQEPEDQRGIAWWIDDCVTVSISAMSATRRVPALDDYFEGRGGVTGDGYFRIGTQPLDHPSGLPAGEVGELVPNNPARPIRYLRCLGHSSMLVILKLDTDGDVPEQIGSEFAYAFSTVKVA